MGCLTQTATGGWALRDAGEPLVSALQSTSASALEAAARRPLGQRSFRLVGVEVFNPRRAGRRKVAVKGVLITAANDSRLNVTSLQPVAGTCL